MSLQPKLGILAGKGSLPELLINSCKAQNRDYFVIAFEAQTPLELLEKTSAPHAWYPIGAVQKILKELRQQKVQTIVLAGGIKRPSLNHLKVDRTAIKWLFKFGIKSYGDDGLLASIVQELEKEGFEVVGAHQIIHDLLTPRRLLTQSAPSQKEMIDIKRGCEVATLLGKADVGQAVIVEEGIVLGVEALEGTDRLIKRCGDLHLTPSPAGVLIKIAKPQQECRVDLPTVGLNTIEMLKKYGFKGLALEAGRTLMLDQEKVIEKANQAGIFILGIKPEEIEEK